MKQTLEEAKHEYIEKYALVMSTQVLEKLS